MAQIKIPEQKTNVTVIKEVKPTILKLKRISFWYIDLSAFNSIQFIHIITRFIRWKN